MPGVSKERRYCLCGESVTALGMNAPVTQLREEPRSGGHQPHDHVGERQRTGGKRLVDTLQRPLQDLRISVTDVCNLRCTYCMPEDVYGQEYRFLKAEERLSFDEIVRLARVCCGLGVTKLRLTGGEPLLRPGLPRLVEQLAVLEGVEDLALTTNGLHLSRQARALKEAGLHRVTVSLDTLDDALFGRMNGRGVGVQSVLDGIAAAQHVGLTPVKVNAVIQKGINDHTLLSLVEQFRGTGVILRFIEYMDVGNRNQWQASEVVASREILARIHARYPVRPLAAQYFGEVAERYEFLDGQGEVGFIASVSQPFCGGCTRARLSADGKLFTCLFASTGFDLQSPLRHGATDDELEDMISSVWRVRRDRYSEERLAVRSSAPNAKVEMHRIGG